MLILYDPFGKFRLEIVFLSHKMNGLDILSLKCIMVRL